MLAEPDRTPYDVNFRLFGFPVRIHPLFWLMGVLLGYGDVDLGIQYVAIWVVVAFVSLLVHELGHALAFRRFGVDSHIVLWMFGGLAVPYSAVYRRWRRIVVSLAGPFAGFALCGLVYASNQLVPWADQEQSLPLWVLYRSLILVNLAWGVMNLFPVFPLDGGQVCREVCEGARGGRGLRLSLQISFGVAVAVAVYSLACVIDARTNGPLREFIPWWAHGTLWSAILFALLAVQSYQLLQQVGGGGGFYSEGADDRVPWEK